MILVGVPPFYLLSIFLRAFKECAHIIFRLLASIWSLDYFFQAHTLEALKELCRNAF